jgi:hypothetical protein
VPDLDPASQTQLRNITAQTGRTVADFTALVAAQGSLSHGQIIAYLKAEHGLSHGNANLIAHLVREQLAGGPASGDDLLASQYAGPKAALRPVLDGLVDAAQGFGADVSVVIQKTGVSLRRRKQFGVVGAPSGGKVRLGLNLATTPADPRIRPTTGMCNHQVDLTSPETVDPDVVGWLRQAYDQAG